MINENDEQVINVKNDIPIHKRINLQIYQVKNDRKMNPINRLYRSLCE